MLEQRKSRRFELKLPFELLRSGSRRVVPSTETETKNVSSTGVLFRTDANLELGETVEYAITLPTGTDTVELRLRCMGKIVRRGGDSDAAATLERWEFVRRPKRAAASSSHHG